MVPQKKMFRGFGKKKKNKKHTKQLVDSVPSLPSLPSLPSTACKAKKVHSLGVGTFNPNPPNETTMPVHIIFVPKDSPTTVTARTNLSDDFTTLGQSGMARANKLTHFRAILSSENLMEHTKQLSERIHVPTLNFEKIKATFIRVADLGMPIRTIQGTPNFHHPSNDPPPGVDHDPQEQWVALDDGEGSHAPIAPYAIAALADFGKKTLFDSKMWKPEGKTNLNMKKYPLWEEAMWNPIGDAKLPADFAGSQEVLVWSGNFMHGHYGSDLPAVRAAGIVGMSPKDLMELLVDSDRTKVYNKLSLGRTDLLVLQDNMQEEGPFGKSITKVMRSESQPPVIRKKMQFTTIMHVKELENGCGYLLVSRAVTQHQPALLDSSMLRSEILMGVNVIRGIEGQPNKCLMINVNHLKTPMVPLFLGKKLGLAAAPNFIHDLRAICK